MISNLTLGKIVEIRLDSQEVILGRITRLEEKVFYFELVLSDWNEQYSMPYDKIIFVKDKVL